MCNLQNGIGIIGSTTIDTIITPDRRAFKLGGVTVYAGLTYRRLGIPVIIVSNLAAADLPLTETLQAEAITIYSADSPFTTRFVNHYCGSTRGQYLPTRARPIQADRIQQICRQVDVLQLGPLHPGDIDTPVLQSLADTDRKIILDVQGYTRLIKGTRVSRAVSDQTAAGLSLAHIVKAAESEYRALLAYFKMGLRQLMQSFKIDEFLVTMDMRGGFVQKRSGHPYHFDAVSVTNPVDPTGAGDVFLAAYVTERLARRRSIPDACRHAADLAARQVAGRFITDDVLALDESHANY